MSLRGSLRTMVIEDVLDWLERRQLTGRLTCEQRTTVRIFDLELGAVISTSSNRAEEQLGQLLVRPGTIEEPVLADALLVRDETHVALGKILLMVGAIDEDALRDALSIKIREAVCDLYTWTDGVFDFDARPTSAATSTGVSVAVSLDGCRALAHARAPRWEQIRRMVPGDDIVLAIRPDAVWGGPAIASADDADLTAVDGLPAVPPGALPPADPRVDDDRLRIALAAGVSVASVIAALGGERFAVLDRLAQLVAAGALEIDTRTRPAVTARGLAEAARRLLSDGDVAGAHTLAVEAQAADRDDAEIAALVAVVERAHAAEVARRLLARPCVPRLRRSLAEIDQLELAELERRLVHRVDGRWDLLSLVRTAPERPAAALLAFARLADRGIVELS